MTDMTNGMTYVMLIIRCPCGGVVTEHFTVLVMTSNGMICFAGPCPDCGRIVGAGIPLTQLLEDSKNLPVEGTELTAADQDWLKKMHIGGDA